MEITEERMVSVFEDLVLETRSRGGGGSSGPPLRPPGICLDQQWTIWHMVVAEGLDGGSEVREAGQEAE